MLSHNLRTAARTAVEQEEQSVASFLQTAEMLLLTL